MKITQLEKRPNIGQDKKLNDKFTHFEKLINELILIPKNFYLFRWMSMGISIFGIPLGAVIATSTKIWGLFGIGIPIGVIIGMIIGAGMDKKAFKEGRQLDIVAVG